MLLRATQSRPPAFITARFQLLSAALATRNIMISGSAHFTRVLSRPMTLLGHSRSISSRLESRREKIRNRPWLVSRAMPLF